MPLGEEMRDTGAWLFRHRSYLPLLLLAVILSQLPHFSYVADSYRAEVLWEGACVLVGLMGVGIRVYVAGYAPHGTSGRSTKAFHAAELNTDGLYSVVRHPLYTANLLMWVAVASFMHTWWLVALVVLSFVLYYERIILAEEDFLRARFGGPYLTWAERTPALFPQMGLWRPPLSSFSFGNAARREHHGVLALATTFALLKVGSDFVLTGRLRIGPVWGAALGSIVVVYVLITCLARYTHLLDGR